MPDDLSKKRVLVLDHGLFVDMAARLGRDFGTVWYCTAWENQFPKRNAGSIGEGIDGIERIDSPFGPELDKADMVVVLDVYYGKLAHRLAKMGIPVWGAKLGEGMELDRVGMKERMKKIGLPVGHYKVVTGMEALRAYLKEHKGTCYVKVSKWRGTFETFKSTDYRASELLLDKIEHLLGCLKWDMEFIIEDELPDTVELAIDGYTVDGMFPVNGLGGLEIKNKGWVGKFGPLAAMPPALRTFNEKIAPTLKQFQYRGFLSCEMLIGKDGKGYMTDACCRAPSPPSELYQEYFTNFSQIVWGAAHGEMVEAVPAGKFGVELLLHSSWAENEQQEIDFPEKVRSRVKLHNVVKKKGHYYVLPQGVEMPEIGGVIGWGDTRQAAVMDAQRIGEQIEGHGITVRTESLDEMDDQLGKMKKIGIQLF